ncbi:hypothetical protein GCM10010844_41220 [Deinococcus radiotolerans]|uniref:Diguanylate cyclase n=2 Tax=Deinococcus radiotolerans TaxID=1309407 RepID=A0ABQ2FR31_9DEIO|nr:hypothetical protein GCM10010844_41220 [Deinococcus radiotolerans]
MFNVVFQHARLGMALVSLDGRYITVNDALGQMLGVPASELAGQAAEQFIHPDDLPVNSAEFSALRNGSQREFTAVQRYSPRTGGVLWLEVSVVAVTDERGQLACAVTQLRDVTAERAQAERLQALSDQLDVAVQATEDGVWDWPVGTPWVQVTERWQVLMGGDPQARRASLRWWWQRIHRADRPQVRSQLQAHLAGTRPNVDVVHRALLPDGHWRWLAFRGRIVKRSPEGRPVRMAGTLTDIEDRLQTQQDLQILLDHLPVMIGYWDAQQRNRFGNQRYVDWYAQPPAQLHGQQLRDVIGPDLYARNRPFIEKALQGEPQSFERRITTPDGRVLDTLLQYIPDRRGPDVRGFYVLGTDITAYRQTEQDLDAQRELSRITLEAIGDGVITTDADGRVTFMNPVAQRLTGWQEAEAVRQPIEQVMPLWNDQARRAVLNPIRVTLRERQVVRLSSNAALRSRLGGVAHIEDTAAPIFDRRGDLIGGVIVFHDVTEKQHLAERMSHLARHDHLTGLPNRTTLLDQLALTLEQAGPQQPAFAVLFVDLDEFKQVNDTLGHALGDEVLRQVAARLQLEMRSTDVVARQGGDEFLILLAEAVTAPEIQAIGERLLRTLRRPFDVGEHHVTVSASLGAALYPGDGTDADILIRRADAAMYRAKAEGRDRLRFYDAQLDAQVREQQVMMRALRTAVQAQAFHLVYQPQVNVRTGAVVGVEALLRWTLPDGSSVSPATFIPLAERMGVMLHLGTWVLREAARQAQAWRQAGAPTRVAVNVSAAQFQDPQFVAAVRAALADHLLPAELLELEVTETLLMHDVPRVRQVLQELKGLGVTLSLDDFGTGYSSLRYLQAFPIDTLKIDRSFLSSEHQGDQVILGAIVSLGRTLGLQVIAEGVETPAQERLLLALGCEWMQGFLYARPMTVDELDLWRGAWGQRRTRVSGP